jgi:hypothetical protein
MLEFEVPAEAPVRIEAENLDGLDVLELEVLAESDVITVWTYVHTFIVKVGENSKHFDFSAVADALEQRAKEVP